MQITANPDTWSHLSDFSTYFVLDELDQVEQKIEDQRTLEHYQNRDN